MDQESAEVASGSHILADVIFRKDGDFIKAEELAREALRIRCKLYGLVSTFVGSTCLLLAQILQSQNKVGDETKELFKSSLAISASIEGPNGESSAVGHTIVGLFHKQLADMQSSKSKKRAQLVQAKVHFEEATRIYSLIYGPSGTHTVQAKTRLSTVLFSLSMV